MMDSREERLAAAAARMAELRVKFLERTTGEIETLRASVARLDEDAGALTAIRDLAHRACGTGATLGFEGISECAARIEALCERQPPGSRAEIAAVIEEMAQELARQREN